MALFWALGMQLEMKDKSLTLRGLRSSGGDR